MELLRPLELGFDDPGPACWHFPREQAENLPTCGEPADSLHSCQLCSRLLREFVSHTQHEMHGQRSRKAQAETEEVKCGRKWTATQLQRKRQLDRESQRVAREKTRNKITHLEALVKSFQDNEDDRIKKLLKKIDEQQAEIQNLRDVLRGINRLIGSSHVAASVEPETPRDEELHEPHIAEEVSEIVELTVVQDKTACLPMDESIVLEDLISPVPSPGQHSQSIAQLAASIAGDYQLEGRLWYLAGGILSYILQAQDVDLPVTTCNDEDIAIRAVFEGWPAVEERYHLDSGWQWLKELDERIYHHLPPHNRLMHMRNTRLVFINQICPDPSLKAQIPPFFNTRPAQKYVQHDPLAEHFPWPGFRERLLFSPLKFATNKFMDSLRTYVDFMWNSDAHDLYVLNEGCYRYSDMLTQRMMDIRCYAARREFFDCFPELRADIPCSAVSLNRLFPAALMSESPEDEGVIDIDEGRGILQLCS